MISDRPITPAQVRAIHVALARQGIDDADYRARLRSGWGVDTCKRLTRRQASQLLIELGRPLPRPAGGRPPRAPRPPRLPAGVVRLATPRQRELIDVLRRQIAWRSPDGWRGWLQESFGLRAVRTSTEAGRIIEGLRAMRRRAGIERHG